MSDDPRVEVRVSEEDGRISVDSVLNGMYLFAPIRVSSMEHGEEMVSDVVELIEAVYRHAYEDGYEDCQKRVKGALGIK